jgi:hypothetical protein
LYLPFSHTFLFDCGWNKYVVMKSPHLRFALMYSSAMIWQRILRHTLLYSMPQIIFKLTLQLASIRHCFL